MNSFEYGFGTLVKMNGVYLRIINKSPNKITVCRTDVEHFAIYYISHKQVLDASLNQSFEIINETEWVVDESILNDKELEEFYKKKEIVRRISEVYGPDYIELERTTRKKEIDELAAETGFSRRTITRTILHYLQSGFKEYSLVNKCKYRIKAKQADKVYSTKTGRGVNNDDSFQLTEETLKQFQDCLIRYQKKKGSLTIRQIYEGYLIPKYYPEFLSANNNPGNSKEASGGEKPQECVIPSLRQLRYYFSKHLTEQEKIIIRIGHKNYRNNARLLTGSSETGVYAPYDLAEMDAVEFDVSLVDKLGRTVGRPIIYMMKDVATRMIIAVSIAFDNNSIVGCTNCIANLNEDKKILCRKYGIEGVTDEMWPTGFKPRRMRFDNGSDFSSVRIGEILGKLNIRREIVPPASGSFKGVIERSFHDAHQKLNHHFEGYGHIKKDSFNTKHHKKAVLDIDGFTKMFLQYVITYNTSRNEGVVLSRDMMELDVMRIPSEVMKYYMSLSTPPKMPEGDDFLKLLLNSDTASLSRMGISYKGLYYLNMDDDDLVEQMYKCKKGRKKFRILYDVRSINTVYYIADGELRRAHLNLDKSAQRSFVDMTFTEYEEMVKRAKEADKNAKRITTKNNAELYTRNSAVVNEMKMKGKADTKNMRENREEAKQERSNQMSLENRLLAKEKKPDCGTEGNEPKSAGTNSFDIVNDDSLSLTEKVERLAALNLNAAYMS